MVPGKPTRGFLGDYSVKAAFLDGLADELAASYRLERGAARSFVAERFDGEPALGDALAASVDLEAFRRRRVCRDFVKNVRRELYHTLRQYRSEDASDAVDALERAVADGSPLQPLIERALDAHVSTRERRPYADAYRSELAKRCAGARTVLDVGCGTHPLAFPFESFPELTDYVALDRDAESLRAVRAFAATLRTVRLTVLEMDFEARGMPDFAADAPPQGSPYRREAWGERFDLALMLKLIPVIERQNPALLERLAAIPARRLLVTGSREAMTRREDISRRELASLRRFVLLTGRRVVARFDLPNEFGFFLE